MSNYTSTPFYDELSNCTSKIFVHPANGACQEVQGSLQCMSAAVLPPDNVYFNVLSLLKGHRTFTNSMEDVAAHLDLLAQHRKIFKSAFNKHNKPCL